MTSCGTPLTACYLPQSSRLCGEPPFFFMCFLTALSTATNMQYAINSNIRPTWALPKAFLLCTLKLGALFFYHTLLLLQHDVFLLSVCTRAFLKHICSTPALVPNAGAEGLNCSSSALPTLPSQQFVQTQTSSFFRYRHASGFLIGVKFGVLVEGNS